jgi:hypothetical protein
VNLSTIKLLREWARWGQGQSIDYPSMSPMFGERALKSPLYGVGHIPEGILEVEIVVCLLAWEDRQIIIQRWQRHRSYRQLAGLLNCSLYRITQRLKVAECEIDRLLNLSPCIVKQQMLHLRQAQ